MPDGGQPTIERETLKRVVRRLNAPGAAAHCEAWAASAPCVRLVEAGRDTFIEAGIREHLKLGPDPVVVKVVDGSEDG